MQLMQETVGDIARFNMHADAHAGTSLMHNDIEIKSYVFP